MWVDGRSWFPPRCDNHHWSCRQSRSELTDRNEDSTMGPAGKPKSGRSRGSGRDRGHSRVPPEGAGVSRRHSRVPEASTNASPEHSRVLRGGASASPGHSRVLLGGADASREHSGVPGAVGGRRGGGAWRRCKGGPASPGGESSC